MNRPTGRDAKKNHFFLISFVLIILLTTGQRADSETMEQGKPLWELGLFNAGVLLPHYRGSDEQSFYALPVPFFIYRGEVIQSDKDGVKGIIFKSDRFEWNVSLFGNPPVEDDNDARVGMPELDPVFEIGPALKWYLTDGKEEDPLFIKASSRGVFSLNADGGIDVEYQGVRGGLNLVYKNSSLWKNRETAFSLSCGVDFVDKRFGGYFYDVDEEYILPCRPYYDSKGGYAGFSLSGTLGKKLTESLSLGFYARWDNLAGAVFEESPLVKEKNNYTLGCALTWTFMKSEKRVKMID